AIHHGALARFFRCAYHAKVMNTFEATSRSAQVPTTENCISESFGPFGLRERPGTPPRCHGPGLPRAARSRGVAPARSRARAFVDAELPAAARRCACRRRAGDPGRACAV